MHDRRLRKAVCWLACGGVVLAARPADACSIPVFRYALERWAEDVYPIIVFHRGPLTAANQKVVDQLEKGVGRDGVSANVEVLVVDLAVEPGTAAMNIWKAQATDELPWMVVRYPVMSRIEHDAWSGRLSTEAVEAVLDSPARREIANRLVDGEAAVWVLLESGDKAKDDAAAELLADQLKRLAETIELSEPIDDGSVGPVEGADDSTSPLTFSVVRIARDNPKEGVFIRMLLRSEPDLETLSGPMAFPIFGRGRVLYALVGAGINEDTLAETCAFLAGPCSCQVKAENPGVDLLMCMDWEAALGGSLLEIQVFEPLASAPVEKEPGNPAMEAESAQAAGESAALVSGGDFGGKPAGNPIMRNTLIVVVLALAGLLATTVVWKIKRNDGRGFR